MQEEVESKAVNLVVRTTQVSSRVLYNALRFFAQDQRSRKTTKLQRKNAKMQIKARKRAKKIDKKYERKEGKQTFKELIRQGHKIDYMPIDDLRQFKKVANKYGVDFAIVKDKGTHPPVYNCFFKANDINAINKIVKDITEKYQKKEEVVKESVLEKLKKFAEIAKSVPRKEIFKQKEQEL